MNLVSSSTPAAQFSAASVRLQRSLERLASDSAGTPTSPDAGETDQTNFSTAAQRLSDDFATQHEATRLQQQDAVLAQAAAILDRIDELKSLHADEGASDDDRAAYQDEFSQLQADLTALTEQSIDGEPLFVPAPEDSIAPEETAGAEESDSAASTTGALEFTTSLTDDFSTADNWVSTSSALSVSDNILYPTAGYSGSVQTRQVFRGAMEISFDVFLPGAYDSLDVSVGGTRLSSLTDSVNTNKWQWHSVRISYDGAGNAATYLDGSDTAADTQTGLTPASGQLSLDNLGLGSARLKNFTITATGEEITTPTTPPSSDDLATVAVTDELTLLDAQTIADASELIAGLQAENDAALAVLETESTPVNNTEETDPAITDSAEAEATTDLTIQEILQNSSDVFLAQANLDEDAVLTLLG